MIKAVHEQGIRLVVTDMAGTVTDYGSCAPAAAFVTLFERHGVHATEADARGPMGMQKRDHVEAMLNTPSIAAQWEEKHGAPWTEDDLDKLYAEFIPLQISVLPDFNILIPGAAEVVRELRESGIAVAGTTGYDSEMMSIVAEGMTNQGLNLDAKVCAEDVLSGRPAPWMIFRSMERTDVCPPSTVVKVGDTIPDVIAGRRAGVWSVGVTDTGNMIGMNKEKWDALSPPDQQTIRESAISEMNDAGAHYVLPSISELPTLITEIDKRIAKGDTP